MGSKPLRIIEFKGKTTEYGKWVTGNLTIEYDGTTHISNWASKLLEAATNYWEMVNDVFEVIPETVCQNTGLLDIENNLIFENDIVIDNITNEEFIIRYYDGAFRAYKYPEYKQEHKPRAICQNDIALYKLSIVCNLFEKN